MSFFKSHDYFGDLDIDGKIILNRPLGNKLRRCELRWTGDKQGSVRAFWNYMKFYTTAIKNDIFG